MNLVQTLDTSGARAAETFVHAGVRYLVVPQLATDVPGQPAQMTLGNSDTEALVYRWEGGRFLPHGTLPVPGGEDAEFFTIGERAFLATASLRTGAGPYSLDVNSTVFELIDGRFVPFQQIPTFAAKQCKHFRIGDRDFLALALGVKMDGAVARHPHTQSTLFEWDGAQFVPFQTVPSAWGYNWAFFEVGGQTLLAHADHVAPSLLLRWNGEAFEPFQELEGQSGRAFCFFEAQGEAWLAFANLHGQTLLHRWADGRFGVHQVLSGPGGREFRWVETARGGRLVQVNFLLGTREAPITALQSCIYRFENGQLVVDQEFDTLGGTDVTAFNEDGTTYLVVTESLSAEVRFRTPSKVYTP